MNILKNSNGTEITLSDEAKLELNKKGKYFVGEACHLHKNFKEGIEK